MTGRTDGWEKARAPTQAARVLEPRKGLLATLGSCPSWTELRLAADGVHMNILLKNTYLHRTLAVTNPLYSELSCSDGGSPGIEVLLTRAVGMWSYLFPGEIDSRTSL